MASSTAVKVVVDVLVTGVCQHADQLVPENCVVLADWMTQLRPGWSRTNWNHSELRGHSLVVVCALDATNEANLMCHSHRYPSGDLITKRLKRNKISEPGTRDKWSRNRDFNATDLAAAWTRSMMMPSHLRSDLWLFFLLSCLGTRMVLLVCLQKWPFFGTTNKWVVHHYSGLYADDM